MENWYSMDDRKKLKVILVEPRGSGGMIHYAYQMCTAMVKEGADVSLITSSEYELENFPHNFPVVKLMKLWSLTDDPLLKQTPKNKIAALWVKIIRGMRRGLRGLRWFVEWVRLTQYLAKAHPDVIQFGTTQFQLEGFFYAYLKSRGFVLSQICHEFESRELSKNIITRINDNLISGTFKNFSVIFFHGDSNKQRFLSLFNFPVDHLHSIRLGNEQIFPESNNAEEIRSRLAQKYKLSDSNRLALFFGNLAPSKGVPELIQAFADVFAQNKEARLVIAGKPSKHMDMIALHKMSADLQLSDVVTFDSRYLDMEEIAPLMQLATVAVYPYHSITQSAALQVAYAFGKPVVATNVGGFPEAVDDGKNGFLVPPESPRELAKAISKIINDPLLAKEMGAYSKHLSETRFAWEPIAREILDVYSELLKNK
jgi:glycosyltransferase involved in cell wall biosynthesis